MSSTCSSRQSRAAASCCTSPSSRAGQRTRQSTGGCARRRVLPRPEPARDVARCREIVPRLGGDAACPAGAVRPALPLLHAAAARPDAARAARAGARSRGQRLDRRRGAAVVASSQGAPPPPHTSPSSHLPLLTPRPPHTSPSSHLALLTPRPPAPRASPHRPGASPHCMSSQTQEK